MSIPMMLEKSKIWLSNVPKDILFLIVAILACSASFGLGMLTEHAMGKSDGVQFTTFPETASLSASVSEAVPSKKEVAPVASPKEIEATANTTPAGGKYVASKSGTRYYLPSCSGANRIKEENKIWFPSKEEAEATGLTPATNCPGL